MKKRKYWEELKILELVADQIGGGFYGMTDQEAEKCLNEWNSLPKDQRSYFSSGWYFHGKLQDDIGYDLGIITTKIDFPIEGKYWCKVRNINKPCIGYFWNRVIDGKPHIRGLVCYVDDINGLRYAEKQYREKESCL